MPQNRPLAIAELREAIRILMERLLQAEQWEEPPHIVIRLNGLLDQCRRRLRKLERRG